MPLSKEKIKTQLVAQVQGDLDAALAQQKAAHADATHEEARAENDKDTRGLETSYLARGLARRAVELQATLATLKAVSTRSFSADDAVGPAALITTCDEDGVESHYFMVSLGGGLKVVLDDKTVVKVVTPDSPLGKALLGREVGDEVRILTPKGKREVEIICLQ